LVEVVRVGAICFFETSANSPRQFESLATDACQPTDDRFTVGGNSDCIATDDIRWKIGRSHLVDIPEQQSGGLVHFSQLAAKH
jgi:hypothetical protein